jgi:hypothetical protein
MKLSKRSAAVKKHGQGQRKGRGKFITVGPGVRAGQYQGSEHEPSTTIDRTDQTLTELHADSSASMTAEIEQAHQQLWDALMTTAERGSERDAAKALGVSRDQVRKLRKQSRELDHDAAIQQARQAMGDFAKPAPAPQPEPVVKTIHSPTIKNITGKPMSESEQIRRELEHWPLPRVFDKNFNLVYLPMLREWGLWLWRQGKITHVLLLRNGELVSVMLAVKPEMVVAYRVLGSPGHNQNFAP